MRASELPSKLFFRIGEVASLVGVEPHVLRYWEREFRSIRPTKSAKGQRVYSRKDVENLLRVRDLLYRDGFTIAGAKKRLQRAPAASAAPAVQASLFASSEPDVDTSPDLALDTEADGDVDADEHDADDETVLRVIERRDAPEAEEDGERVRSEHALARPEPMREKLTALRAEVEGFLFELETGAQHETQLEADRGELADRA